MTSGPGADGRGGALAAGLRLFLLGWVGVLVLALAWTALALAFARDDARAAERALTAAQDAPDGAAALERLEQAQRRFAAVASATRQPGPRVVAVLPVLGRTVTAVRTGADAGAAVSGALGDVLEQVEAASPVREGGRIDADAALELEASLRAAAGAVDRPVDALVRTSTDLVPSLVGDPVREARRRLDGLPEGLRQAAAAVGGLRALTGGERPHRILLAVQNNAELRATGGLVSVFAELTAQDGRVQVGPFREVEDVADPAQVAVRVPAPDDYTALWGPFLANSTLWKNTNMSPDVPTSSAVLAEVAATSLGARPDVVLWLDVRALAAVLQGTSAATLQDGTQLTGDNAVDLLLSDAYEGVDDQDQRRARLREVADAVAERLLGQSPDLTRLAPELATAAAGRHLAVWAADPDEQRSWRDAGAAAPVEAGGGDLSSMAVHNLGGGDDQGNKLDYYARRSVDVQVEVGLESASVVQRFELRNEAPATGLSPYVAGAAAGTSRNLVSFAVPTRAEGVTLQRGTDVLAVDPAPAGDHALLLDVASLSPGATTTWELRYTLPVEDRYALQVVPQPLVVDAELRLRVRGSDGVRLDVDTTGPVDGELDRVVVVEARPRELPWPSRVADGVRRFWSEPVQLP